jgi:nitroreductase
MDVILDRRSIVEFKEDNVPQDVLDKVLQAALRASGPGGTLRGGYRGAQPYSIIEVRDRARRRQLNELLCEGRRVCIETAPVSLIFCVDTHRMNRWAALSGGVPHFRGVGVLWVALRGVYTAAQNAVIAAESLGLGSQYVQEIVWQPYKTLDFFQLPVQEIVWQPYKTLDFFQLPPQVLPVAMLLIGYPAERPPLAPSLPLEAIVHKEVYEDPEDEELLNYFAEKEQYFQEWLAGLPEDSKLRQHIAAQGVSNLAQWVSLLTYTESFYKWRDDMVRTNLHLSELE